MTAPTAQMRCLSPEKATELAERLRAEDGVPAALTAADGDMLRAPIDNIGFAFAIVATAVEEGYADDDDAGQFQQAAIDHAGGHPGLRTVGLFCDSCRAEFEAEVPGRNREEAFESIRKLAIEQGWGIAGGVDLCPDCFTEKPDPLTLLAGIGKMPVRFWICPERAHRRDFIDLLRGSAPETVRWFDGIAHCMARGCSRTSADPETEPLGNPAPTGHVGDVGDNAGNERDEELR